MNDPQGWKSTPLRELVAFAPGFGFPERFQGSTKGELPFFKVSDMSTPGNERVLHRANNYVPRELATRLGWKPMPAGSVAFAKVGAALLLNRRREVIRDSLVDNNMMGAVAGPNLDRSWLYWWLRSVDFGLFVQPGALPSVNQKQLAALNVNLPPLPEQRLIAQILDTLDEAIRKTEQLIAKLKLAKQGLLHDLLTRGIDENGELRDPKRHPEQFKDSPLGRIPREWEVTAAREFCTSVADGTHDTPKPNSAGKPLITSKNLRDGRLDWTDTYLISEADYLAIRKRSWVQPGDILFGMIGTIGSPVILQQGEDEIAPKNVAIFRFGGDDIRTRFFEAYAQSPLVEKQLREALAGSTQRFVGLGTLRAMLILSPTKCEMEMIVAATGELDRNRHTEALRLVKLRLLKTGLMDDLLTGRVRVTPLLEAEP